MRPEVVEIIHGRGKKKTKNKYKSHFKQYVDYCRDEDCDMLQESTACNFFHDAIQRKLFGVGSLWTVFASINSGMKKLYRINMNKWEELKKLLMALKKPTS